MSLARKTQREILNACRRSRPKLDSKDLYRLFAYLRQQLDLKRAGKGRKLPRLLTDSQLERYYKTIDRKGILSHQIMLRLLFYTGIRVSELCSIEVDQVDLEANKIFISQGKGKKDRYILFPESFRMALKAYMATVPDNRHLFESRHGRPFSARRIQQIMAGYGEAAALPRVHPHILRHQLLTWLTKQHLPDSAIQLISGHASKKTLEVYQHLALADVEEPYQAAMKKLDI